MLREKAKTLPKGVFIGFILNKRVIFKYITDCIILHIL